MVANGALLTTQVESGTLALSAYAVAEKDGSTSVVLVNKDRTRSGSVTLNLGASFTSFTVTALTGPSLDSATGELLEGAPIAVDGSFSPPAPAEVAMSGSTLEVLVAPASAVLLRAR